MNSVMNAAEFAVRSHGKQMYGSDKPYEYHLRQVYENAVRFGGNLNRQQAAWLHDVIEDTHVTYHELVFRFGVDVANIVRAVTNIRVDGRNYKEGTYIQIANYGPDAVFVKLCDRLANVTSGELNNKYYKEMDLFHSILYTEGQFEPLWNEIEKCLNWSLLKAT